MIGQTNLHNIVNTMLQNNNNFPKFVIFVGPRGSGKKTFIKEHFDGIYLENNKIDSVRKLINLVYKVSNTTFILPDADDMSTAARNALLKIVEECPNNNYFIMTLEDINNTLDTIKSRATVFYMDNYTRTELQTYFDFNYKASDVYKDIVLQICDTPGEIDLIQSCGGKCEADKFYDYVNLVVDNIIDVSISNVFKIGSKINIKDAEQGYDLKLFWKAFQNICIRRIANIVNCKDTSRYGLWTLITSKYLSQLRNKGVNRQMLFDDWILEVRENGC